jgi:hypothetical protein
MLLRHPEPVRAGPAADAVGWSQELFYFLGRGEVPAREKPGRKEGSFMYSIIRFGPLIAHFAGFIGSLGITLSMQASRSGDTWMGGLTVTLVHPLWLRGGLWLLVVGFFIQIVIDFYELLS